VSTGQRGVSKMRRESQRRTRPLPTAPLKTGGGRVPCAYGKGPVRTAFAFVAGVVFAALMAVLVDGIGIGSAEDETPDPSAALCAEAEDLAEAAIEILNDVDERRSAWLNAGERAELQDEGRRAAVRWATVVDEFPSCFSAEERVTAREFLETNAQVGGAD